MREKQKEEIDQISFMVVLGRKKKNKINSVVQRINQTICTSDQPALQRDYRKNHAISNSLCAPQET